MSGAEDYIDGPMAAMPGWFSATDAWLFTGISRWQQANEFGGDLLEIGVYQGRSAVLLGHLVGDHERLVLCDLFDQPADPGSGPDSPAGYAGLTLDGFLATYRDHHSRPPIVYQCLSNRLGELETSRAFRMIHIDGSHAYNDVRCDIDLVPGLLLEGGIVILDDYRTLHTPGVSAAIWETVVNRDLRPICLTHDKMYASWGPERPGAREGIRQIVDAIPWVDTRDDTLCGHEVFIVLPKGYGEDPPVTRPRLVEAVVPPVVVDLHRRFRGRGVRKL